MEKPTKVEIGQQYRGRYSQQIYTVVEKTSDGWVVEYDDGERIFETNPASEFNGTYLGGPSPEPVRPTKPGLGQVWRHHDANGGANYELTGSEPWHDSAAWQIKRVDPVSGWAGNVTQSEVARSWTFVRYIDTPEPVAPPKQRRCTNDYDDLLAWFPPESGAPPTASRVETPVLPHCRWQEQKTPGAEAFYVCENRMVHAESMFCEKHIAEAMIRRDTEKREARKESPFQQSHCGRNGMLGIWSLREEER